MAKFAMIFISIFSVFGLAMENNVRLKFTRIFEHIHNNDTIALEKYLKDFNEAAEKDLLYIFMNKRYFILHKAILNKNVSDDIIEILLKYKANPNNPLERTWNLYDTIGEQIAAGSTPVHCAVIVKRSVKLLEILKNHGGLFAYNDSSGQTPLAIMAKMPFYKDTRFYKQQLPTQKTFKLLKFIKKHSNELTSIIPLASALGMLGYFYYAGYDVIF